MNSPKQVAQIVFMSSNAVSSTDRQADDILQEAQPERKDRSRKLMIDGGFVDERGILSRHRGRARDRVRRSLRARDRRRRFND